MRTIGEEGGVTEIEELEGSESLEMMHEAKFEVRRSVECEGEELRSETEDPIAEPLALGGDGGDVWVSEGERELWIVEREGGEASEVGGISREAAAVQVEMTKGGEEAELRRLVRGGWH